MTPGKDIPRGNDETIDALRKAWDSALDTPLPLDADDEPRDPLTARAVHWTREAWAAQSAPTNAPDIGELLARRRSRQAASQPKRAWHRDLSAAAAVFLLISAAAWMLDRTAPITTQSIEHLVAIEHPLPMEHLTAIEPTPPDNGVIVAHTNASSIELVSGPVRLILVTNSDG